MNYLRGFPVVVMLCMLGACSTTSVSSHRLQIDGIEIVNLSSSDIESFQLTVPRDGIVITANKLREGSRSLNGVEPFPYRRNTVSLRWFQDGVKHTMDGLKLSEEVESAEAVTVVVELHDDGRIVTYKR